MPIKEHKTASWSIN